jgi:hypothetical protein
MLWVVVVGVPDERAASERWLRRDSGNPTRTEELLVNAASEVGCGLGTVAPDEGTPILVVPDAGIELMGTL